MWFGTSISDSNDNTGTLVTLVIAEALNLTIGSRFPVDGPVMRLGA